MKGQLFEFLLCKVSVVNITYRMGCECYRCEIDISHMKQTFIARFVSANNPVLQCKQVEARGELLLKSISSTLGEELLLNTFKNWNTLSDPSNLRCYSGLEG